MTDKQIRPPYEIALMHDHILRLEEELKAKEQECEELKNELHKIFEEKDTLHLIIDRLLEASGYDTNTASAEEFEDVYEHMRYEQQQLDQLKAENEELKAKCKKYGKINEQETKDYAELKAERDSYIDKYFLESQKVVNLRKVLTKIKEICNNNDELKGDFNLVDCDKYKLGKHNLANRIMQIISEVENEEV